MLVEVHREYCNGITSGNKSGSSFYYGMILNIENKNHVSQYNESIRRRRVFLTLVLIPEIVFWGCDKLSKPSAHHHNRNRSVYAQYSQ